MTHMTASVYYICVLAVRMSLWGKLFTLLISGVGNGDRGKETELLYPLVSNFLLSKAHIVDSKIAKMRKNVTRLGMYISNRVVARLHKGSGFDALPARFCV